jgi:hypothetical protein
MIYVFLYILLPWGIMGGSRPICFKPISNFLLREWAAISLPNLFDTKFQICHSIGLTIFARSYLRQPKEKLIIFGHGLQVILTYATHQVRIICKQGANEPLLDYNPFIPPHQMNQYGPLAIIKLWTLILTP